MFDGWILILIRDLAAIKHKRLKEGWQRAANNKQGLEKWDQQKS